MIGLFDWARSDLTGRSRFDYARSNLTCISIVERSRRLTSSCVEMLIFICEVVSGDMTLSLSSTSSTPTSTSPSTSQSFLYLVYYPP